MPTNLVTTASAALAAILVSSCCPAKPTPPSPPEPTATAAPTAAGALSPPPPRDANVVVVFVVDQFGSWVLEHYREHLPADGAMRRGIDEGVYVDRVVYPYASTNTAPGHAAIFTGQPPAVTGITANRVFHPTRGLLPFVDDGEHAVHGRDNAFASPSVLRVPTVGDALHDATDGKAEIIVLSGKDRATVVSAGRHPDLALWYDYKIPAITTSSFYADAVPPIVTDWVKQHPIDALIAPWKAADRKLYEQVLGPDDGPGEGDWLDFGTTFPHDPKAAKKPYSVLRTAAPLTEYMFDLITHLVDARAVGNDDVTDLVVVSISGVDYAGHTFGNLSWEYMDHLFRADRAMGKLVRHLEKRARVSVLITSDHGIGGTPEKSKHVNRRIYPDAVVQAAEAATVQALGPGEHILAFTRPLFYFKDGLTADQQQKATAAVQTSLKKMDCISDVFEVAEARGWAADDDPVRRAVALSVDDKLAADLYVLFAKGCIVDEDRPHGQGTSHGTPWSYDTDVPVIFFGPGVSAQRVETALPQNRVAPTISALLGVDPPAGVTAAPLPGAPKR